VNFQQELNPEQLEAVETLEGPVLVIAGAGSGKTRTLVYRVARLVQAGIDPGRILLLTFTRKAAAAMLARASELMGPECQRVAGGTFHGFAHGMLRRYGHLLGFPRTFTVMDRSDVQDLLHFLAGELDLRGTGRHFPKRSTLAVIASRAAICPGGVTGVLEREFPHLLPERQGVERLIAAYGDYKKAHALLDYDDLLVDWRDVLIRYQHVRAAVGRAYQYIMVDEYQDTNSIQAEIVRLMASGHDNVMVVGDDAQSIYSFRGANFKNILDFPTLFSGARIIKLERNYRATQPNLDCTNAIIAHAREKFTKHLVAQRTGGLPPLLYVAGDEVDQARFVADRIVGFLSRGVRPSEVAVLFRAGFHSFQLETALNHRGLAFVKRGGLRLVEAAHVKDLVSLLRLLINPLDRLSWKRALSLIEGVGPKAVEKVYARLVQEDDPLAGLAGYPTSARWRNPVRDLGRLLLGLRDGSQDLLEVLSELEKWYLPRLERAYPEDHPRRAQELAHLKGMAARYADAVSLLADLALDPFEQEDQGAEDGRLVLSTMHSAKGLEWKVVFVISLAEGRFPSPAISHRNEEVEEERRLFYVAATRARDHLFFCYPALITVSGTGLLPARPSRFLEEIPQQLLVTAGSEDYTGREMSEDQARQAAGSAMRKGLDPRDGSMPPAGVSALSGSGESGSAGFSPGARVRHPIFGPGRVLRVLNTKKLQVLFDVAGEKTLHLDYAKLSLLDSDGSSAGAGA